MELMDLICVIQPEFMVVCMKSKQVFVKMVTSHFHQNKQF